MHELVLVKVRADSKTRAEVALIVNAYDAKIVSLAADHAIVEMLGSDANISALLGLLEPFGILELARTGRLALKH
jgi:acetolactate synthase-1/3 small subunit